MLFLLTKQCTMCDAAVGCESKEKTSFCFELISFCYLVGS